VHAITSRCTTYVCWGSVEKYDSWGSVRARRTRPTRQTTRAENSKPPAIFTCARPIAVKFQIGYESGLPLRVTLALWFGYCEDVTDASCYHAHFLYKLHRLTILDSAHSPRFAFEALAMDRPGGRAHPLTFRVMRLTATTPSRRPTLPFVGDAAASPPDAFLRAAPRHEGEGAPAAVGTVSILPASFGSIYAAETFRSYISTYNMSANVVRAVAVSVEIQTATQRRVTLVPARPAQNLRPRDAISHVVSAPLPELGVHVLVCSATYVDETGAPRHLRQLFRFNVLPPLEPFVNVIPLHRNWLPSAHQPQSPLASSTNPRRPAAFAPPARQSAQFLVDLRVLNTMPVPVYITSATLIANPPYSVVAHLVRSDDPAAPDPNSLSAPFHPVPVDSGTDSDSDSVVPACTINNDIGGFHPGEFSKIPLRAASTGVGDTRNFLFYVARSIDPQDSAATATAMQPPPDHHLVRTDTVRSPRPSAHVPIPAPARSKSLVSTLSDPLRSPFTAALALASSPSSRGPRNVAATTSPREGGSVGGEGSIISGGGSTNITADTAVPRREIGCFSLAWHSGSGERGRMDNVIAAFEPVLQVTDVELRVSAVPQDIYVQTPFAALCVIRNNSAKALRLYLQVRRDLVGEIVPFGISGVSLGKLAAASSTECLVTLIPLTRGQHSISGLRVVDIDTQRSFNAEPPVVSVI
jgi:Protein of unknown function (DUF974)